MDKEKFILTKEMVQNAKDYMPISYKVEVAKIIAGNCVKPMKQHKQNVSGNTFLALPEEMAEDMKVKLILLQNTLLSFYFDITMDENENIEELYDYYAESHIMNQIERFKGDAVSKDKVFDILADYKEFKKILDTEIYNLKENANNSLSRFSASVALLSNPDNIQQLVEELKITADGYTDALKEMKSKKEPETDKAVDSK